MCTTMKYNFIGKIFESNNTKNKEDRLREKLHDIAEEYSLYSSGPVLVSEYRAFCILREPKERLASAFLSKFVRPAVIPGFARRVLVAAGNLEPENFSFTDFVEYIQDSHSGVLDEHWAPQSKHLLHEFSYHFVLMENADKDPLLRSLYGDNFANLKANALPFKRTNIAASTISIKDLRDQLHVNGTLPTNNSLYTSEIEKKVEAAYHDDLVLITQVKRAGLA